MGAVPRSDARVLHQEPPAVRLPRGPQDGGAVRVLLGLAQEAFDGRAGAALPGLPGGEVGAFGALIFVLRRCFLSYPYPRTARWTGELPSPVREAVRARAAHDRVAAGQPRVDRRGHAD